MNTRWIKIAPYALLSLGTFVAGLILVDRLLTNARLLVSLGLVGPLYYLVLLPFGLCVAAFTFGALHSVAIYHGKQAIGTLEIRGAFAGFCLTVLGGILLPAPAANFPLTVFVHGPGGPQDSVLRNEASVVLDLGSERRNAQIGDQGQAFFSEVPASFRGQKVDVGLDATSAYEPVDRSRRELSGTSLYLEVRRKPSHIAGTVVDENGTPIAGASVIVNGLSTTSGKQGEFRLTIPAEVSKDEMDLRVSAAGYATWNHRVIPNGSSVTATLHR